MFGTYLDPKNDFAFKKIFGTIKNKDILISFLNDVVTFKSGGKIQDVSFLTPIQDPEIASQKTSIVDILCEDDQGNKYIVEMQVAKEKGFEKRAQYYASKAYSSQMHDGGKYFLLKEIIFLAIINFVMFPNKKNYKSDHVILDKETYEHDLKDFSFTFIELPKFNKPIDDLPTMTDKWCYFFKHATKTATNEIPKLNDQDHSIEKAFNVLNNIALSPKELLEYEQAEKNEGIEYAIMAQKFDEGLEKGEKLGLEKGEKLGLEKGEKLGLEKGEKLGFEKGSKEQAIKIAQALLIQGVDIETIQKATDLSYEAINALQEAPV